MNPDDTLYESVDEARHRTIVDTLLDGDAVDKHALREALHDASTRDYFIDALLLRQLAVEMAPNVFEAPRPLPTPAFRMFRWTAAAVVVISTAVAGYSVGREQTARGPIREAPTVEAAHPAVPAPEPTHTIRFEPGANWISDVEGR
jgi:hypothetical protein